MLICIYVYVGVVPLRGGQKVQRVRLTGFTVKAFHTDSYDYPSKTLTCRAPKKVLKHFDFVGQIPSETLD